MYYIYYLSSEKDINNIKGVLNYPKIRKKTEIPEDPAARRHFRSVGFHPDHDVLLPVAQSHALYPQIGFNGSLGIFHRGRSNVFALADDLIEPFRPCIDDAVLGLPSDASPSDPDVKRALVAAATQRFNEDGLHVPAVVESFAQQFGRYVEGDIQRLDPPVWRGPFIMES